MHRRTDRTTTVTLAAHARRGLISSRKIPQQQIRKKLLDKHEKLGIICNDSDEYFANLTQEEIKICLNELKIPHKDSCDLRQQLKEACRTRYLKVWHDHSSIAAHGYLLVLVSVIYDPAFYYTTDEMKTLKGVDIDVPATIEKPEVHIFARSSSSTEDQLLFVETRRVFKAHEGNTKNYNWSRSTRCCSFLLWGWSSCSV